MSFSKSESFAKISLKPLGIRVTRRPFRTPARGSATPATEFSRWSVHNTKPCSSPRLRGRYILSILGTRYRVERIGGIMTDFLQGHYLELALMLIVLYALVSTHFSIYTKKQAIERTVSDAIKESKTQIEKSISPRIVYCASIDQVRSEAAEIISKAAHEFAKAVQENTDLMKDGSQQRKDISQYFVTIYGAASLFNESDAGKKLDDSIRQQSIERYREALALASEKKLHFRRYVSLIDENELKIRSENVKVEYLEWLHEQLGLLHRDANYTMIVSPRAPRWGASNTSLIANPGIIEIKGHGGSAFAIYDRRIAVDLRVSLRGDIYDALPQNKREVFSGDEESMKWFEGFINKCDSVLP